VARAREIDCSSGTGCSGVASNASSTRASTPTPHRTHFRSLTEPRIKDFSIDHASLELITENSVTQSM
jgi:hypothetical protein